MTTCKRRNLPHAVTRVKELVSEICELQHERDMLHRQEDNAWNRGTIDSISYNIRFLERELDELCQAIY